MELQEEHLRYGKLVKFYQRVVAKICKTLLIALLRAEYNIKEGPIKLEDITAKNKLKNILDSSNKDLAKKDLADGNVNLDIQTSYSIAQVICSKKFNSLDRLEKNDFLNLKLEKNKLCHEDCYSNMSEQILCEQMDCWIKYLESIIKGTKKVVKIFDANEQIQWIHEQKISILNDSSDLDDCIKQFEKDRLNRFITTSKEELVGFYNHYTIITPCQWLDQGRTSEANRLLESAVFTEPVLKLQKTGSNYDEIEKKECKDLFKIRKNGTEHKRLFKIILMHGLAGSGKTTVCRHLLNQLKEEYDLVILVEIRALEEDGCSLVQYIRKHFPRATRVMEDDEVINLLLNSRVLYLIDGYDEQSQQGKELIKDLCKTLKGSYTHVLITTRPEYQKELECIIMHQQISNIDALELCGFTNDKIQEFSKKVFDHIGHNGAVNKFLEYIEQTGSVLSQHLQLPLTISLLILLWVEDPEIVRSITTATELYQNVFALLKMKLVHQCQIKKDLADKVFEDLCEVAFKLVISDSLTLTDIKIEECRQFWRSERNLSSDKITKILSSFLKMKNYPDKIPSSYSFLHRTQIEFMAACHVVSKVTTGEKKALKDMIPCKDKEKQLMNFFKYVVGHFALKGALRTSYVTLVFENLKGIEELKDDYNYWYSLLCETASKPCNEITGYTSSRILSGRSDGNNHNNKLIFDINLCKQLKEYLKKDSWCLDFSNVVSGLFLLYETSVYIEHLEISIMNGIKSEDMKYFFYVFKKSNGAMKNRKSKIKLELHLHPHLTNGLENSDRYLKQIKSWAKLVKFTGHIGSDGSDNILSYQWQLKDLTVRLSSVKDYIAFCNASVNLKKLQRVHLEIDFFSEFEEMEVESMKISQVQYSSENVEVSFPRFEGSKLNIKKMKNLLDHLHTGSLINKLQLRNCNIENFALARMLIKEMQDVVSEKITITYIGDDLTVEQEKELENLCNLCSLCLC